MSIKSQQPVSLFNAVASQGYSVSVAYGSSQGGVCAPPSAVNQALPFTISDLQIVQSITKQPFTNYEINLIMENNPRDNNDVVDEATNEGDLEVTDGNEEPPEITSDDNNISEQIDDAVQVAEEDNVIDELTDEEEVVSEDSFSEPSVDNGGDVNTTTTTTTTILVTPTAQATAPTASPVIINSPTVLSAGGNIDLDAISSDDGASFEDSQSGQDSFGNAVAGVGDIDGDGLSDFAIGATIGDGDVSGSGVAYVIKGQTSAFSDPTAMSSLTGGNGFKVDGESSNSRLGGAIGGGGDINGDGYADMIFGGYGYDSSAGRAYVIYGKSSAFSAVEDVTDTYAVTPTGIMINGSNVTSDALLGQSVDISGDINGDGFDDILVGAPYDYDSGSGNSYAGVGSVIFGSASPTNFAVSSVNGSNGFQFEGSDYGDYVATAATTGDINGDGFDDYIVSARYAYNGNDRGGNVYVLYGKASGFSTFYKESDLDGSNGFVLQSESGVAYAGETLATGDINGDGYSDIIIGAPRGTGDFADGQAYVYFGSASPRATQVALSGLDGSTGFYIGGLGGTETRLGSSVTMGDFNADGYDDFIVGGNAHSTNDAVAYLIFGKASGWSADLDLSSLSANEGVELSFTTSAASNALNQRTIAVDNAGDVDGDGVADIIASIDDNRRGSQEGGFIIYGSTYLGNSSVDLLLGTTAADTIVSDGGADRIVADLGNDTITGGGGADVIYAGLGDDEITTQSGFLKIDGGGGSDTLILSSGNLDLTTAAMNGRVLGIETIDLVTDTGANTLTLNKQDVLDTGDTLTTNPDSLANTANSLIVTGAANDAIVIDDGSGWSQGAAQGDYNVYTNGQATLFVESTLTDVTGGGL